MIPNWLKPINLEKEFLKYRDKRISLNEFKDLIIKYPKKINKTGHNKRTLLNWCAYFKEEELLEFLLKQGADPNILDYKKRGPIYWAVHWNSFRMVSELVKAGADYNQKAKNGYSPYNAAEYYHYFDIMEFLIQDMKNNQSGNKTNE